MAEAPGTQPSTSSSDQSYSQDSLHKQSQLSTSNMLKSQNGGAPVFPIMYPALVRALFLPHQHQEQMNRGPGLYAVPVHPYMQSIVGFPPNTLIPFTYNIPTERSPEMREAGSEQGQPGEQLVQQQAGLQRQVVVRRFQIAIQLDLLLILKLAAVVFLFNQDESRQRLTLLVFFAFLVYLYQTGALAPVIRWLSRGMRRAAAPPVPPRPAARPENLPAVEGEVDENNVLAVGEVLLDENEQIGDGNPGRMWVILKEIQMIVFGFITSLLPGFHNID